MVDEHDPLGEPLDLRHVVRGQQRQGPAALLHLVLEEAAHLPDHHVDPMVGSSRNTTGGSCSSAAARSQRTRWPRERWRTRVSQKEERAEQLVELAEADAVFTLRHPVDVPQDREGLTHRQVPPQLGALPEHRPDVACVALALPVRDDARDARLAGGRGEDAGEHLDGGGLAGAVRAEQREQFAGRHLEGDVADGLLQQPARA